MPAVFGFFTQVYLVTARFMGLRNKLARIPTTDWLDGLQYVAQREREEDELSRRRDAAASESSSSSPPSLSVGALTRSTAKWKRQLEGEENMVKQLATVRRDRQIFDLRIRPTLVGFSKSGNMINASAKIKIAQKIIHHHKRSIILQDSRNLSLSLRLRGRDHHKSWTNLAD